MVRAVAGCILAMTAGGPAVLGKSRRPVTLCPRLSPGLPCVSGSNISQACSRYKGLYRLPDDQGQLLVNRAAQLPAASIKTGFMSPAEGLGQPGNRVN